MALPTKIMLISADASTSNSVCICLLASGYRVIYLSRGSNALEMIYKEKPALVIVDIDLPDFNSLAIVRLIRSDSFLDTVPVILMGSNLKEDDALIGLEAGADLCLMEAFHPQVFVARVRSLLRRCELVKVR
jgi:DNA-binding response OmpR family regulator